VLENTHRQALKEDNITQNTNNRNRVKYNC